MQQFPELFKGLGKLKDSYKIKLREGATPFAPRRVPIPLLPKVKEELQRMENVGVITSQLSGTQAWWSCPNRMGK